MQKNKVQILLSTYNGEKYLTEQIESLLKQNNVLIDILVRDDGSTDTTKEILSDYQLKGVLKWYEGNNIGPAKSFLNLLFRASDADFYAFCDQDDVWESDKLKSATDFLKQFSENSPCLYFSNTEIVDLNLNHISSPIIKGLFTFGESLIRNSATGCTVVFNAKLLSFLQMYSPTYLLMHDAWAYQLCLALNGQIYFDEQPHIKYRQHSCNVVGQESFVSKLKRRYNIYFRGKNGTRLLNAKNLMQGFGDIMTEENKKLLTDLINYKKSLKQKVKIILAHEFKTKNIESNIGFIISILFNKF